MSKTMSKPMSKAFIVASKEFSDIVRGKRFLMLVIIFGLAMTAAVASTYLSLVGSSSGSSSIALPRGFLGAMANNLVTMMTYFAPIMGLALGFDVISGEREKGTLKTVVAQPVYRDSVINGKFLAALGAVSLATIVASLVAIGGSVIALNVTPTIEDITRLSLFMLVAIIFSMVYYGIAAFLSTVCKRTSQSIIIGVVIWILFSFIIGTVASLIAFSAMPIGFRPGGNFTQNQTPAVIEALRSRTSLMNTIESITPNYHFEQISQYLLQMYQGIRLGPGGGGGFDPGTTSTRTATVIQSLGYAWPNMLVLVFVVAITFVASYMIFTRQEIR
jgi:ABC-2 type transport system permease protein